MTSSAFIPPMKWCGVPHPHEPHTWAEASPRGFTGFYASCPGSRVAVAEPPDTAMNDRYRKKPVEINARQLTRETGPEIWEWADSKPLYGPTGEVEGLRIYTLEGDMRADFGDWIIRGVKGEFYPCKPDIFAATYEPVTAPDTALGRCPALLQCHRETGHHGGHEAREENTNG